MLTFLTRLIAPYQRHVVRYREFHCVQDRYSQYLEGATDLHDLEQRMRDWRTTIYIGMF